eukprot:TRINITY_DN10478_c0_g1_i17.p1 TRINITY_DN10478_c0_g1~~TRINITY_DN10478_c0_g1_i17.p1  ORF type:complete len:777 (+),score=163.07 TRINITY_DN10478_c0_g1_i17:47-2377(+)
MAKREQCIRDIAAIARLSVFVVCLSFVYAKSDESVAMHGDLQTCVHDSMDFPTPNATTRERWLETRILEPRNGGSEMRVVFDYTPILVTSYDPSTCYSPTQGSVIITNNGVPTSIQCTTSNYVSPSKRSFIISTLIPAAVEAITDAWYVASPRIDAITTRRTSCAGVSVPSTLRTTGIANADLVVIVSGRPTVGSVIAYAGACDFDATSGRPILGLLNLGMASLTVSSAKNSKQEISKQEISKQEISKQEISKQDNSKLENSKDDVTNQHENQPDLESQHHTLSLVDQLSGLANQQAMTVAHELIHILGFSSSLFSFFEADNVLVDLSYPSTTHATGYAVKAVASPSVLEYAREFYGCSSLGAVPLEDFGGSGTAGSHWEKRILFNELMSPTISLRPILSGFTVALLVDSGWYTKNPNFDSKTFDFGRGQSCSFVQSRCNAWSSAYLCSDKRSEACFADRRQRAECSLITVSSGVPSQYRISSDSSYGGYDQYADYCPMFTPNCPCDSPDLCDRVTIDNGAKYRGESYGDSSICLDQTVVRSDYASTGDDIGCHQYLCRDGFRMMVNVGGVHHSCAGMQGQLLSVIPGICFQGSLRCPSKNYCANSGDTTTWPSISSVSPAGSRKPKDTVTLLGSRFFSVTSVTVGCSPAESFQIVSDVEMKVQLPKPSSSDMSSETTIVITTSDGRTAYIVKPFSYKYDDAASDFVSGIDKALRWFKDMHEEHVWFVPVICGSFVFLVIVFVMWRRYSRRTAKQQHRSSRDIYMVDMMPSDPNYH